MTSDLSDWRGGRHAAVGGRSAAESTGQVAVDRRAAGHRPGPVVVGAEQMARGELASCSDIFDQKLLEIDLTPVAAFSVLRLQFLASVAWLDLLASALIAPLFNAASCSSGIVSWERWWWWGGSHRHRSRAGGIDNAGSLERSVAETFTAAPSAWAARRRRTAGLRRTPIRGRSASAAPAATLCYCKLSSCGGNFVALLIWTLAGRRTRPNTPYRRARSG